MSSMLYTLSGERIRMPDGGTLFPLLYCCFGYLELSVCDGMVHSGGRDGLYISQTWSYDGRQGDGLNQEGSFFPLFLLFLLDMMRRIAWDGVG